MVRLRTFFSQNAYSMVFTKIEGHLDLVNTPSDAIFIQTEKGFKGMPDDIDVKGAVALFRQGRLYTVSNMEIDSPAVEGNYTDE